MKLPPALESRGITLPIVIIAGVWIACVAFLAFVPKPPTTTCVFKRVTGYPCATCGSTRAFQRLTHADFAGALAMNPLMTVFMLAAPVAMLLVIARGRRTLPSFTARQSYALLVIGLVLLVCNWTYLIWQGR